MDKRIYIVGVGPGDMDFIIPAAMEIITGADVLIGGKRNLEPFKHLPSEKVVIGGDLESVCGYIAAAVGEKSMAVLVSGDPGIFSMLEYMRRRFGSDEITVIPGISSLQYFCSKLGTTWHDAHIVSLHGREHAALAGDVAENLKVIIFTGGKNSPDNVCRDLLQSGFTGGTVTVGTSLSYPDECIVKGSLEEIAGMEFESLSLMMVERDIKGEGPGQNWQYCTPGIPDAMFIRGDVPMTKQEIRAITLSKLMLRDTDTVYDIGAGTGSVSIECGLACRKGTVYAIERDSEALELIEKNTRKFRVGNVRIVAGEAPGALEGLPFPDRVFIGGSSGNMDSIIEIVSKSLKTLRIVINAVTLESAYEALKSLEGKGFDDIEVINVAVSRGKKAGGKHLMQALNPVYIISAEKAV